MKWLYCDALAVASLVVGFMLLAHFGQGSQFSCDWMKSDARDLLGAEYDSIAVAIFSGRGYSDPFRCGTGPTSWMPPVLPYFLAFLYCITGDDRSLVVGVVLMLQALVVFWTILIVVADCETLGATWFTYIAMILVLFTNFHELFQKTHDGWLVLLLTNCIWLGIVERWDTPIALARWGLLGGVATLSSPILGAVWACLTIWRWLRVATCSNLLVFLNNAIKPLTYVAIVCSLIVTPWLVRDFAVFGVWVPIKSNAMFELWQSQCLDDDGVLDMNTTALHPYIADGKLREIYEAKGEIRFVSDCGVLARESILSEPGHYGVRVLRRLLAATLIYQAHDRVDSSNRWIVILTTVVFPFPAFAILAMLCFKRRWNKRVKAAVAIYCMLLLPYVLVSYCERYAMPLIGIKLYLLQAALFYRSEG